MYQSESLSSFYGCSKAGELIGWNHYRLQLPEFHLINVDSCCDTRTFTPPSSSPVRIFRPSDPPFPPKKGNSPPVVGNFNVLMSTTHGELPNNHVPEVCDIKEGTSDTLDLTSLLL
ncbi:hypothetical protein CDAR_620611 [Caerostris darwini]|uniref:Uncharacterized protein n=1 Tax=Caerostris darwini TaxID=1538125 RepID=A0AAV4PTF9_9ARAC|nr:hypothetical protein CDAR_620611 [Caerostris darwini]